MLQLMTAQLALTSVVSEGAKKSQGDTRRVESSAKWPKDTSFGSLSPTERLASLGLWRVTTLSNMTSNKLDADDVGVWRRYVADGPALLAASAASVTTPSELLHALFHYAGLPDTIDQSLLALLPRRKDNERPTDFLRRFSSCVQLFSPNDVQQNLLWFCKQFNENLDVELTLRLNGLSPVDASSWGAFEKLVEEATMRLTQHGVTTWPRATKPADVAAGVGSGGKRGGRNNRAHARGGGKSAEQRIDGNCWHCGKAGHKMTDCRSRKAGKPPVKDRKTAATPAAAQDHADGHGSDSSGSLNDNDAYANIINPALQGPMHASLRITGSRWTPPATSALAYR